MKTEPNQITPEELIQGAPVMRQIVTKMNYWTCWSAQYAWKQRTLPQFTSAVKDICCARQVKRRIKSLIHDFYSSQDCNAKMKECPQCRHALMNARNRTAESLAQVLANMKSVDADNTAPGQPVVVSVSDPEEVKKRLSSYVTYRSTFVSYVSSLF